MHRASVTWTPRPIRSMLLRTFIIVMPLAAGLAVTWGLARWIPRPSGPSVVVWWVGISLAALVALFLVERAVRHLSPLAVLLRLSLAFPDRAPSRLRVARKSGNLRRLKEELDRAREQGQESDLTRAAENILALAAALSAHDRRTRGHSERVRVFTDMLAAELRLPDGERQRLRWAALLHDIGKLRVPAKVLNKERALDVHEWSLIHRHPEEGLSIAEPLVPWLGEAADAIRQHHERFDGTGYPTGLRGAEISRGARIVAVADAFETMTAGRPYQRSLSPPMARQELARHAGSQFDPAVVRALLNLSITNLWWRVGLMAWISQIPLLGRIPRAAHQLEAALPSTGFAAGTAAALTAAALAAGPVLRSPQPSPAGARGSVQLTTAAQHRSDAPIRIDRRDRHRRTQTEGPEGPEGSADAPASAPAVVAPGATGAEPEPAAPPHPSTPGPSDPPPPASDPPPAQDRDVVDQVLETVLGAVDEITDTAEDLSHPAG